MAQNKLIETYEKGIGIGYELAVNDMIDACLTLNMNREKRLTEFFKS